MLGTPLLQALTARRSRALQLVRGEPRTPDQLHWNPQDAPIVDDPQRLEGLTAAIHLSGAGVANHRWTESYKHEIQASRVDSTHALARALAALRNPPPTLVVASAIGIYGNRAEALLTEDSEPGTGFMADVCRHWEAAAQPAVDAGIRVVHARFGVVLGPTGGALAKMLPLFRLGLGGHLGSGRQWMSWISTEDVVAGILFAIDTAGLTGAVNFTAPAPVTNAEFTKALARAVHRPAFLPAPAFALRLAMGQMADEALLASARVLPAKLSAAGFSFTHPTLAEALAYAAKAGS
jgi:uncharacterized protein (TIGR01777 family)